MKYCRKCGCELRDDAAFCDKCGEKVETGADSGQLTVNEKLKKVYKKENYIKAFLIAFSVVFVIYILYLEPMLKKDQEIISLNEFYQIAEGMSYNDVVSVIGCDGKIVSQSQAPNYVFVMMKWQGNGRLGSNAIISFENGRVTSKSQYRLK